MHIKDGFNLITFACVCVCVCEIVSEKQFEAYCIFKFEINYFISYVYYKIKCNIKTRFSMLDNSF
jgi:hypothetical protein